MLSPLRKIEKNKLRILLFSSLPENIENHQRLEIETEQAIIQQALAQAELSGNIMLKIANDGCFSTLKQSLKIFQPDLVYLSGHSEFQIEHHNQKAWGSFLFEDKWGKGQFINEDELSACFRKFPVQAVMLSACKSAKQHPDYPKNGLAQSLHLAGIPYVIGMRESFLDQAGIQFAKVFFNWLCNVQQPLPIDQALQQARAAISESVQSKKCQWHLPILLDKELNKPLFDSSATIKAKTETITTIQTLNGIKIPKHFIGRRRELRQWQNALHRNEVSELLIIGAGGMGKTALTTKLLINLQINGYTGYILSLETKQNWRYRFSKLESLLKDQCLIEKYQKTVANIPNSKESNTQQSLSIEIQRAKALLGVLLKQYHYQFVLLIDNLETCQNIQSQKIIEPSVEAWIQAAQSITTNGLKLLLTSRWKLPYWKDENTCILGKPIFTDYLAYMRSIKLPPRFMVNTQRQSQVYETLGGNYRALQYFSTATEGMSLIQERGFLDKLKQVTHEIQINMALAEVISQCSPEHYKLLNIMRVYLYPVNLKGIQLIIPFQQDVEKLIKKLLSISLLEQYWSEELNEYEYLLSPLVKSWMLEQKITAPEQYLAEKAALYFLDLLEDDIKVTWYHILNTHQMLSSSGLQRQAHQLVLDWIVGTLSNAGYYQEILLKWLPDLLKYNDKKIVLEALNQEGTVNIEIGNYSVALEKLKSALTIAENINNLEMKGHVFHNLAEIYTEKGLYDKALDYLKQSLDIAHKLNDIDGEVNILNGLGDTYTRLASYDKAEKYLLEALSISEEINDEERKGYVLNNLAEVYRMLSDFKRALEFAKKSLVIAQKNQDKSACNITLNNISLIYSTWGEYDKALSYLHKVLVTDRDTNNKDGEGTTLNNIGDNYRLLGLYDEAQDHFQRSLEIRQKIGDREGEAVTLNNIALIQHEWQEDHLAAIKTLNKALGIQESIKDIAGKSTTLHNIAQMYESFHDYDTALLYLDKALIIQNKINDVAGSCFTLFNMGYLLYFRYDRKDEALKTWAKVYKQAKALGLQQVIDDIEDTYRQIGFNIN